MPESTPLLAKITRPRIREAFPRERLFRTLDETRRHPVTWISAPAGSGKTTLVASYLDENKIPCLWYQVDEGDSDLATFFNYLGMAARKAAPQKRKSLPLFTPEYYKGLKTFTLRYFENLFSRLKPPSILVLDNYQTVPDESNFHEVIKNGISTIPDGINVIVISRHDPPPILTGLRANESLKLLGWDDLRLTLKETTGIVPMKYKEIQSLDFITQLHQAADGWVAGLILMLASVKRGIEPKGFGKVIPEEIVDYFASELLNKIDPKMQEFFLKTAFLPRMTAKMAEELTNLPSANQILSTLSRINYFLEKRFHKEPVYQYHPLYRDFLCLRARETFSPDTLATLLRRAARLLEEDGQIEPAIELFRDLGDWDAMAQLIIKQAPSMLKQGRYRPLKEWLDSLPEEMAKNDPWLLFWKGAARHPFDPSRSQPYYEQAFEQFQAQDNLPGLLLAGSGVVYSILNGFTDYSPLDRWIPVLEKLWHDFKEFPSAEIELRFTSAIFSALVFRRPQHPDIESWAERTLSLAEKSSNLNLKIGAISTLAHYWMLTGDFARALLAINSLRELSQSKESTLLNQMGVETVEGFYCRHVGLYEKCLKAVSDTMEISRTKGIHIFDPSLFHSSLVSALNINDHITATRLLNEMSSSMSNANPFYASAYHNAKCQEALFRRDLGAALLHVEQGTKSRTEVGFTYTAGMCHLQNAYVLHALGRHGEAADYLSQTFDFAREIKSKYFEYSALVAGALFAFDQGEEASGLKSLRSAMILGREGGYFGIWGPLPHDLARLCMKALEYGIEVEFVQEIIRRHKMMPDPPPLYLENWPWTVKIYVLGRFELFKDGQPVQFNRKAQKKPLLMLKAMIALGGKDIDEERLMDILWPEADGDQAYSALTTTLSRLRQLLGEKVLEVQAGRATLNPRYCWVDVRAFEGLADKAEDLWRGSHSDDGQAKALQLMGKAVELYQGPFLRDEGSMPFWALPLGERLKNRFLFLIEKLGRSLEQREQWGQAIVLYRKGLEVDNLAEELYRRLMACYGSLGETVKAVQVYRQLKTTLASILEIEPSPKTETLYRTLTTPLKIKK